LTRSIISQRITSILDDIQRLNSALYAMNSTDIQRYPDNYEVLSTDAALRAETITCRLRQLLYVSTNVKKSEYLASAAAMQGIDIQQRGGIFEITLPCLLPKRRQSRSTEYLIDPLTAALEQYVKGHTVRRFRHCVVCFSHTYCQDLPERRVRDYDNLEIKRYLDAVGAWLLTDDVLRRLPYPGVGHDRLYPYVHHGPFPVSGMAGGAGFAVPGWPKGAV